MSKTTNNAAQAKVERKPRPHSKVFTQDSRTQQQFKASVDVNNIVNHYRETGIDPYAERKAAARFGSVPSQSYTEAMFHVAEVNSTFHALDASIRAQFANDPARWLAHLEGEAAANARAASEAAQAEPETSSENPSQPPGAPSGGTLREGAKNRPENADLDIT